MADDVTLVQPSLLSQIVEGTLDAVSKKEVFSKAHVDALRVLLEEAAFTPERIVEALTMTREDRENENH